MLYSVDISEMPALVRDFASYKSAIQNCSVKTVSEYLLDLRTFFRFLVADREGISPDSEEFLKIDISGLDLDFMKSISTEDIYGFLMYSGTVRNNLWSAKARKLSAIKAFFKFLTVKRKLIEVNPAIDIESPKPKKSLPKVLTIEEAKMLLDAVKSDKESKSVNRDYAIITLFLNCGMRVSELVGIDLSDIDHELRSLRVVGKGNKERIVYLNDACRYALGDYISERAQADNSRITTKALFLSSRDQRISVKTVQWMVYKYLDAAGLGSKHYSVHKLRHTAATLMYQSGNVDVRVLKDILGHEQLNKMIGRDFTSLPIILLCSLGSRAAFRAFGHLVGASAFKISSCLCGEKLVIQAFLFHQLAVSTRFDDSSILEHYYKTCYGSAGKTVGNENSCLILAQAVKLIEYLLLRQGVKGGGWLVKNENVRIRVECACNRQLLPLTARKLGAVGLEYPHKRRIVSLLQMGDILVRVAL